MPNRKKKTTNNNKKESKMGSQTWPPALLAVVKLMGRILRTTVRQIQRMQKRSTIRRVLIPGSTAGGARNLIQTLNSCFATAATRLDTLSTA